MAGAALAVGTMSSPAGAWAQDGSRSARGAGPLVVGQGGAADVRVDPRIELMSIIQLLADYPVLSPYESDYRERVRARFGPFADHPAVGTYRILYQQGLAFDRAPKFFVSLGPLPGLQLPDELPPGLAERTLSTDSLAVFADRLAAFAEASDFERFFVEREEYYLGLLEVTRERAAEAATQLERYTGHELVGATVVLSPLLHDGGFAMFGGTPQVQAFIGPSGVVDGGPDFGGAERLGPLIWHEFAHTVVNPLTEAFAARVAEIEVTDAAFRSDMRRHAYASWPTVVSESVIRALEVRLASTFLDEEAAARMLERQLELGFCHVPALAQRLAAFEAKGGGSETLADVFPALLDLFADNPRCPAP